MLLDIEGDGGGGYGRVFAKHNSGGSQTKAVNVANVSGGRAFTSTVNTSGTSRINNGVGFAVLGTTYHFAVTYSSGTAPIHFINGVSQSGTLTNGTGTDLDDSTQNLYIGNRGAADRGFDGNMTDIGLFSSVLSSTDISEIYDYGLSPTGSVISYGHVLNDSIWNDTIFF